MILYRISNKKFSNDISGEGASQHGGRWNREGTPLLYCASNVSLASLEVFVNLLEGVPKKDFDLVVLNVSDTSSLAALNPKQLTSSWIQNISETQLVGQNWSTSKQSLILEVPSAIVPIDKNYLLNPNHANFSKVEIIDIVPYHFDNRLFKTHVF